MSSFRQVTAAFSASPQISLEDVAYAAGAGFKTIICNRPDGEDGGQLGADAVAKACEGLGLAFIHIPVVGPIPDASIAAMQAALHAATGPVLAYCRSGTRSTNLWALAEASSGRNGDDLVAAAAGAGYDLRGLMPTLRALAAST